MSEKTDKAIVLVSKEKQQMQIEDPQEMCVYKYTRVGIKVCENVFSSATERQIKYMFPLTRKNTVSIERVVPFLCAKALPEALFQRKRKLIQREIYFHENIPHCCL